MKISTKKRKIGYVHNSISGYFSQPGKRSINFESKLEKDFLTMISFNNQVEDIIEQPFTIEYEYDGKLRRYTPDFLVFFKNNGVYTKPLLVEVKRREELIEKFAEFKPKFKAAITYSNQEDYFFKIYDQKRIYGTYFENIELVKRYRRNEYPVLEREKIIDYLSSSIKSTIDNILVYLHNEYPSQNMAFGHICQLLELKILSTDFKTPIHKNSVVWNTNKELSHG